MVGVPDPFSFSTEEFVVAKIVLLIGSDDAQGTFLWAGISDVMGNWALSWKIFLKKYDKITAS